MGQALRAVACTVENTGGQRHPGSAPEPEGAGYKYPPDCSRTLQDFSSFTSGFSSLTLTGALVI